jgi:hypothetical protein
MKRIFSLLMVLMVTHVAFSQTITRTASTVGNLTNPDGGRAWFNGGTSSTASPINNGQSETDYMWVRGFDFSSLPANIVVTGLSVTFTIQAGNTVVDSAVRLVLGGAVYMAANTNAAAVSNTWPTTATSTTYTFSAAALSALNTADFQNANFGVAILARRTAGNTFATVNNTVSITLSYSTVAPLILTDFSISKNEDNHVDIRFATATEDNVQTIFVERSSDGKSFEKLFTITPRGARNVYTRYTLTDKTPVKGNNYYRITEVDKNGRWFYYLTKMINITTRGDVFNAYYNGGQVVANITNTPGVYEVALVDMSGVTISRKQVSMNGSSAQVTLDAPSRSSVYIMTLKGNGLNEAKQIAILK